MKHIDSHWQHDYFVNHHDFVKEKTEKGNVYAELKIVTGNEMIQRYHTIDPDIING